MHYFILNYLVLVLLPQNEIVLHSSFFFCFSKLNCLFGFSSRKVSQRDSSMAAVLLVFDNLIQAVTADYRKNPFIF